MNKETSRSEALARLELAILHLARAVNAVQDSVDGLNDKVEGRSQRRGLLHITVEDNLRRARQHLHEAMNELDSVHG